MITTSASIPLEIPGLKVKTFRVPSISWRDLRYEIEFIEEHELSKTAALLMLPFSLIFGAFFDFFFKLVAGNHSDGKWAWSLTALPVLLAVSIFNPKSPILATGGPSVAQFLAALNSMILKRKLIVEFQDPFFGSQMLMSARAKKAIQHLEQFIIEQSTGAVYATSGAAFSSRQRYPKLSNKVWYCYPGAWNYQKEIGAVPATNELQRIEFLHVGTLYGSRNLDLFFKAIDLLVEQGFLIAGDYNVVNLGGVHIPNFADYHQRPDFQQLESVDRVTALARASASDVLLLVQHSDSRSLETIPFKTYDYLNLGKPILGILNNPELSTLVDCADGVACDADSIASIVVSVKSIIGRNLDPNSIHPRFTIDATAQWKKLLSLVAS